MRKRAANVDNSLDSILIHLGDFGKYQTYVFSLVCVAVVMHSMVHIAYVFTAMNLDYRCKIPQCDQEGQAEYLQPWLNHAIPFINNHPDKCSRYASSDQFNNCSSAGFDIQVLERCGSFVYNGTEETILQEYGLQCDNNLWKLTMVGTVNNIGQFFGLIISGIISDKYGRKFLLVWGMILCAVCGCAKAFMPTYEWFLTFEFLDAAFGSGSYICGFVLGAELVGPSKRVLTGTLISSCYAVGEILVALIAWLVKSWKYIVLTSYIPIFLLVSYLWLIPESVRWNLSNGRIEEAKKTLRKAAKVNGKKISEKELEFLDAVVLNQAESSESLGKSGNLVLEAVKSGTLMLRLVACCVCWITCTFLFYGLTLNSVSLVAGNNYLDFILTALVEIPAYFACNFIVNKYGRKKTLVYSYLLTGAACLAFVFIPPASRWGSLSVYLIGKFGATASFTILYIITSEMFPTNLRHSFMGTCSTFGRCGSMISPQTPLLAQFWEPLPLVSFAAMSILAGLLTLLFPETLHQKLPDTVYEAEMIGRPILPAGEPEKQQHTVERF
ncbi:organic cation transporter protein isoform X2 [Dendroctonus ponderosae]|uniref:Major facilitator superfamily (MFS) profile domain-containing protein n=1 Tax=Dendroctonus ponderosae TaxID=77166 RepID=J3JWW6_DENPD